jgi:DNA topoisomerase-2
VYREIEYCPALFKIFDELLVNAADQRQRDPTMNLLWVELDAETQSITIRNNGVPIDISLDSENDVYVPELIFGHLLTSSAYDDSHERLTGGRNGFGAKLSNIFSSWFEVEIVNQGTCYLQTWKNHMKERSSPKIFKTTSEQQANYTQVKFIPDFKLFHLDGLTKDMLCLFVKRILDIAGTCAKPLKVSINGHFISFSSFANYTSLYLPRSAESANEHKDKLEESGAEVPVEEEKISPPQKQKIISEVINDRWEVCICPSWNSTFQQISFCSMVFK